MEVPLKLQDKIKDVRFFDFDLFTETVVNHFKEGAGLIGITDTDVVTHHTHLLNGGLLVEIYLDQSQPLQEERLSLRQLADFSFNIDIKLKIEGGFDSQEAYNKLVRRTQVLAWIAQHLELEIARKIRGITIRKILNFTAIVDNHKSIDSIYNACRISGEFTAYF